ncbi:MAG TPA: TonB family protein [Thermoanaerobaculia bacterium]|nr:TonB family protein [Thermoanaerobaculia bacterium]
MTHNVLVVEYEPRYTDRVRSALAGQPVTLSFARDGEEALRALAGAVPELIILSSVVPKGSAADIIRAVHSRNQATPILLTVSGYNGASPAQDAHRYGATDLLPKPFSEADLLGKVQQLLRPAAGAAPAPARKPATSSDDIDKLLADTLGGVRQRKSTTASGTTPRPKSSAELDKLLEDTLSGLEKRRRRPEAAPAPAPPVAPDRVLSTPPPEVPAAAPPPPQEEEEPADGTRFGQYVLLEKIAAGGMAEVWKARKRGEEGFQKIVAIKKILPHLSDNQEFIEMFIDEAKLAAQLNHNNIIHIYDLGKIQSSYFIAMEYVDGYDLKTILKRGEEKGMPLGVELSLFIASRLAAALDYAHRKRDFNQVEMGLVHRDVSPQNVLISQEGDVKLCDFGIAKAAAKASHTQAGALKGKLQYMSPEQAWGRSIDRRSDIFAVAAVLFEMLAGRKLFSGDNEMSILEQVREARITPPSRWNDEVAPEIDAIVARALQKDPAQRHQTAADMAKELDAVLYGFRPTPTSADLAIYMHRLSAAEPVAQPVFEEPAPAPPPPPPAAAAKRSGGAAMPAWEARPAPAAAPKGRSAAVPLMIVALLVAGIIGAYFYVRGLPAPELSPDTASIDPAAMPSREAPSAAVNRTPAETGTLVPLPTETTNTIPPAVGLDTMAPPPLDPALVDLEVQRLLATERARLEQEADAQRRQMQTATVPPLLGRAPVTQPPATQIVPPQPQPQPPPPQPQPQAPPPAPVEEEPQPAPPSDPAPAAARYSEGDLVPVGTEGLTPARVIRYGSVPYPPMARSQRVEGTVLITVLVSERGEVLEVRLLRGISRHVGLNEAAAQVIRRSTFSAPMMDDGTRVKAWATVPVKFEL